MQVKFLQMKENNSLHRSFVRLALYGCLSFFFLRLPPCLGTISNDVPPLLRNTEWVDRIEVYGCSARTFRAFQPQSHADLLEALMVYADADCAGPQWLLEERQILGRSYLQSEARVFALLANDVPLRLIGQTASVDPFQSLREGRSAFSGSSLYGELNLNSQGVKGGEWGWAFSVTPGLVFAHENANKIIGKMYLQEGYFKAGYRRTEIVLGRIPERFGDSKHGNLILSAASKPIDLIKLVVRPHWIRPLSFLGPATFQTWIGSDENTSGKKDSRLWGLQFGMRPLTFLEFGFLNLMQFGGTGAPSLNFSDYFNLLIGSQSPEIKQKRHQSYGTHLALWGPSQEFKIYNQLFFGTLGRVEDWFSEDVSWLVGIWFPKWEKWDLRFEWAHTQSSAYSDSQWTQGWTNAGSPLGHPLGNSGQGFYLDLGLPPLSKWRPELEFSYEQRNRDQLEGLETETRLGMAAGATRRWLATELNVQLKVQRVENLNYSVNEPEWAGGAYGFLRYSFL